MKNKILTVLLVVFALILSVALVNAAVTVTSTFGDTTPTFGSESQQASNPNADASSDEDIYDTSDVTFNNDGSSDVTITSISVSPASGFDEEDLDITLDDSDLIINANSSEAVTLSARIPEQLDAVDKDGDPMAFKVGQVTVNFDSGSPVTFDVYMQRENKLELKKVYVTSEEEGRKSYTDGDKVEQLKPGEDIEVEVKAESNYDKSDDDVEMQDITATIIIDDGDMDVDEEEDLSDLEGGEEDTVTIKFDIEDDVDEDTYDGSIYIIGEDEHGARHGEKFQIDLEVERQSHELKISTTSVSPSTIECQRSVTMTAKIANTGKKDEDEVYLYVKSDSLGIDFSYTDFELDSDDSLTKTFNKIIPDSVKPGTYIIRFNVYYSGDEDEGVLGDLKDTNLVVKSCAPVAPVEEDADEEEEEEDVEIVVPDDNTVITPPVAPTTTTTESSFMDSDAYLIILVAAIVAAFFSLVILLIKLIVK